MVALLCWMRVTRQREGVAAPCCLRTSLHPYLPSVSIQSGPPIISSSRHRQHVPAARLSVSHVAPATLCLSHVASSFRVCAMFNGHIPYTPIVVDDFTSAPVLAQPNTTLAFFLTHYHKDHIRGLTPTFSRGTIYATKVTRALLLIDLPRLRPQLRTVDVEEKTAITLNSGSGGGGSAGGAYTFYVTAFDANHCPGAVILLFHLPTHTNSSTSCSPHRAVLHTGDMRYDPLRFHSPLLLSAVNHIDTLFLDCTFFHPTAALFPSKAESIRLLTALIASYFKRHSTQYNKSKAAAYFHPLLHPRVYIAADMLGTEELLLSLHAYFCHRMYVTREWDRWRQLALLKRTLPLLVNEQWNTPFTICAARQFQQFKLEMDDKRKQEGGVEALYVKPSAMWFVRLSERRQGGKMQCTVKLPLSKAELQQTGAGTQDDEVDVEAEAELDEVLCDDSEWVARDSSGVVHVLWSMHSAMSECLHFIQLLQPRFIVPINPPVALTSLTQHCSDESTTSASMDSATAVNAGCSSDAVLTRKRRSSSITQSKSIAERDRLVVTSLQRYIDSLLPHRRIVVQSPITAAEAEAKAGGEAEARLPADVVPDTPPRLQGVKRMHSSPCQLQTISDVCAAVKAETKAEVTSGGVAGRTEAKTEEGGGSRVNRALFGTAAVGMARAHSTLLVVREQLDRTLVWQGAQAAAALGRSVKDEKVVVDDMPSLTRE